MWTLAECTSFLYAGHEFITILSSLIVYKCAFELRQQIVVLLPWRKDVCVLEWGSLICFYIIYFFERQMSKWKCQVGSWIYGSGACKSSVWVNVNHVSKLSIWGQMCEVEMKLWPKSISWGPTSFQRYWKEQRNLSKRKWKSTVLKTQTGGSGWSAVTCKTSSKIRIVDDFICFLLSFFFLIKMLVK